MTGVVDFHSHVLPGIDDGSRSPQESAAMLRAAAEQGVEWVVATPHFYPAHDHPERFFARRRAAESTLREHLANDPAVPGLSVGAEVHYFPGISDSEWLQQLTIENTEYVLVEMPMGRWTETMYRELEAIWQKQRLMPIVAHIDRYLSPLGSGRMLRRLEELPVLVQANASFFLQPATANMALRLLRQDRIHLLGSDCHNMTDRPPNLGGALERIRAKTGEELLDRVEEYSREVLQKVLLQV